MLLFYYYTLFYLHSQNIKHIVCFHLIKKLSCTMQAFKTKQGHRSRELY
uniref:Uncharacterized protein n=1 Tax=Anguilla anguilla TaxID=7936 RepID=A0A0E9W023_ANGAN